MWTFIIESIEASENKFTVMFTLLRNGEKHRRDSIIVYVSSMVNVPSDERDKYIQKLVDQKCQELTAIEDVKVDFSGIIGQQFNVTPNEYKTKEEWETAALAEIAKGIR